MFLHTFLPLPRLRADIAGALGDQPPFLGFPFVHRLVRKKSPLSVWVHLPASGKGKENFVRLILTRLSQVGTCPHSSVQRAGGRGFTQRRMLLTLQRCTFGTAVQLQSHWHRQKRARRLRAIPLSPFPLRQRLSRTKQTAQGFPPPCFEGNGSARTRLGCAWPSLQTTSGNCRPEESPSSAFSVPIWSWHPPASSR